jgi:hypothetical protein
MATTPTSTTPKSHNPVVQAQVTVTLSPAIQQRLIQLNAPIFAAVTALKELGLLDAVAAIATGKPLTPLTVSISSATAGQVCRTLSRITVTDAMAAEVGTLVNSIPPAMRTGHPGLARPLPIHVVPPVRPPHPAPKPVTPPKAK